MSDLALYETGAERFHVVVPRLQEPVRIVHARGSSSGVITVEFTSAAPQPPLSRRARLPHRLDVSGPGTRLGSVHIATTDVSCLLVVAEIIGGNRIGLLRRRVRSFSYDITALPRWATMRLDVIGTPSDLEDSDLLSRLAEGASVLRSGPAESILAAGIEATALRTASWRAWPGRDLVSHAWSWIAAGHPVRSCLPTRWPDAGQVLTLLRSSTWEPAERESEGNQL